MTLWKWSQTAVNNDIIDSTINLAEGQAPSTLNNSGRSIMAAVAKYRDDMSGWITTSGTSTAYTISSYQGLTALTDKFAISFTPHVDCGAAPTFQVDGQTAKPLIPYHGATFVGGELKGGGVYTCVYNASNAEYVVDGFNATSYGSNNADLASIHGLGSSGSVGILRKTAANTYALDSGTTAIIFEKDGNGTVLSTGIMGDSQVPFAALKEILATA